MKLKDALELMKEPEKLRIRAAEKDGWVEEGATFNGRPMYRRGEAKVSLKVCPKDIDAGAWWMASYELDANPLHEAEKRLGLHDRSNTALRVKWVNCLHDLVGAQPECPVNKSGPPLVSDIDVLLCSTLIRCAAYVMTAEWKEAQK